MKIVSKKIALLTTLLFLSMVYSKSIVAGTYISTASGLWLSASSWSNGLQPGSSLPTSSTVTNVHSLTLGGTSGTLNVTNGTTLFLNAIVRDVSTGGWALNINNTGGSSAAINADVFFKAGLTINNPCTIAGNAYFGGSLVVANVGSSSLLIKSGYSVTVGGLDVNNTLTVEPGATLVVVGDLVVANNGNARINLDGTIRVTGQVTVSNAISGVGQLISGPITVANTGNATVFGSGPNRTLTCSGTCTFNDPSNNPTCTGVSVSISRAQTICSGATPSAFTSTTTGTITSRQWQVYSGTSYSNITGATIAGYSPSALTSNTTYRLRVSNSTCTAVFSTPIVVSVNASSPSGTGVISGGSSVCQNSSGASFNVSGYNNVSSYNWTLPSGFTITSGSNSSTITVSVSGTATSGVISVIGVGGCGSGSMATQNVTVQSGISSNTLSATFGTICTNSITTITGSTPSGGSSSFTYLWQSSNVNSTTGFTTAPGTATNANYVTSSISGTTWFRRIVSSATCASSTSTGLGVSVLSQSNGWIGNTSSNWSSASNWCGGSVPGIGSDVVINSGLTFYPVLTVNSGIRNITITGGASLTINASTNLTVAGNWVNNGTFTANTSTLIFTGNTVQSISGTSNSNFYNISLNSASGISLLSSQTVYGSINFVNTNADLASNGYLILGSNATGTGRIGTLQSGNTITGAVTVQNYMGAKINARLLSFPVQSAPISQLQTNIWVTGNGAGFDSPSYIPTVYTYVESVSGATNFGKTRATSTSQTFNSGQGYEVLVRSRSILATETRANQSMPAVTISVSGTLTQGNVTFPISYRNNGITSADGWNLVGNPYPSQIDWNASSGWTKTNISSSIYLLDPGSSLTSATTLQGQMYTYNLSTGCIPAVSGCSSIIAQGQGFYVKATAAGANLAATESVKTSTTGRRNFRSEASQSLDLVRVMVQSTNGLIDETLVRIGEGFTDSLESADDDIMKFQNGTLNFCTRSAEGLALVMNSISLKDSIDKEIPLEFVSKQAGDYTLNVNTNNLSKGVAEVYLKDKKMGTETKVNGMDTVYFSHDVTDTTNKLRFSLVLRKLKAEVVEDTTEVTTVPGVVDTEDSSAVTGIKETLQMNVSIYPNPIIENSLTISLTNSPSATRVGVYNFMGEEVYGQNVTTSEVTITGLNVTSGTYFVKITMKDGSSIVKKVVKL